MLTEGSLSDFRLPDLLQILALGNATGTLTLKSERREGRLHFQDGRLVGAQAGEREGLQAADVFLWRSGVFDFAPLLPEGFSPSPEPSLEAFTSEGLRQLERYEALRAELPDFFSSRTWVHPMQMFQEQTPALVASLGSGMTVSDLVRTRAQGELATLEEVVALFRADQLGLSSAPEEQLRALFKCAAEALFSAFAGISGVKMVEGLEAQLNELAATKRLAVLWRNGRVQDNLPDAWRKDELLAAYRPLLAAMEETLARAHGASFVERVETAMLDEVPAPQRALWKELSTLPTHSS